MHIIVANLRLLVVLDHVWKHQWRISFTFDKFFQNRLQRLPLHKQFVVFLI